MNTLPDVIREVLAPYAPAQSSVQFSEAELVAADRAVQAWKDGFHQRNDGQAQDLQIKYAPQEADQS